MIGELGKYKVLIIKDAAAGNLPGESETDLPQQQTSDQLNNYSDE